MSNSEFRCPTLAQAKRLAANIAICGKATRVINVKCLDTGDVIDVNESCNTNTAAKKVLEYAHVFMIKNWSAEIICSGIIAHIDYRLA